MMRDAPDLSAEDFVLLSGGDEAVVSCMFRDVEFRHGWWMGRGRGDRFRIGLDVMATNETLCWIPDRRREV